MGNAGLFIFLPLMSIVLILLYVTYRKLQDHRQLIRTQSEAMERQVHKLMHQNELQVRLNKEKQQIVSVISHDLKGPFNRIFALVQLLNMTEGLSEEQKEYMGKIHQISIDGLNMVRNLLDNRKLEEQGGLDMAPEELNLSAVVYSLVKHYRTVSEKKKIEINFEAPKQAAVVADRNYINRIVENLLSNAVKFSPPSKKVFVSIIEEGFFWCVMIKDEGLGFTEEDGKKMFTKFQVLSARPTSGESSTGLGLWIVKTLVEKSGGEISYESRNGAGATFYVRLKKSTT